MIFLKTDWYDYGARFYDPAIGRWFVMDPLMEESVNWTPYRYGFNNPILFNDAYGLWEQTANGWTTNDANDIARFIDMMQFEEIEHGEASVAQIDQFINEEFNGTGGKLSNGSVLLSGVTAYGNNNDGWSVPGYQTNRMNSEIGYYSSFTQNQNNFVGKFSFYSYKYYRERSWDGNGGNNPVISLTGFAATQASLFLSNSNTWLNLSNMRVYSQSYFGNQYDAAELVAKNKSISKSWSVKVGVVGTAAGLINLGITASEYSNHKLTPLGASYLGASEVAGVRFGKYGAAWSLGTSLGKSIVESNWYFNAVHGNRIW